MNWVKMLKFQQSNLKIQKTNKYNFKNYLIKSKVCCPVFNHYVLLTFSTIFDPMRTIFEFKS
jgi:hypothetical protein